MEKKGRQEKKTGKNRRRNEGWMQAKRKEGKKERNVDMWWDENEKMESTEDGREAEKVF